MESTRLPGKVLLKLKNKSVFSHQVERMRECSQASSPYLATSKNPENQILIAAAIKEEISYYCGAEEDLSERYITIMNKENAIACVRCAGDQPLFSYEIVGQLLSEYNGEDYLYPSTKMGKGIGLEIISLDALNKTRENYRGPAITKYILEYPHKFNIRGIEINSEFSRPEFRLTLDTMDDYELLKVIYERFYKIGKPVDLRTVFRYLDDNPNIANINRNVEETLINKYVPDLLEKPIFSIYKDSSGRYLFKNRMSEIVPPDEFKDFVNKITWEE